MITQGNALGIVRVNGEDLKGQNLYCTLSGLRNVRAFTRGVTPGYVVVPLWGS
ncbi:hypothetical protein CCP3SC1_80002 [Gammaproteobacteria bacterium]